jgi:hypothetical protein
MAILMLVIYPNTILTRAAVAAGFVAVSFTLWPEVQVSSSGIVSVCLHPLCRLALSLHKMLSSPLPQHQALASHLEPSQARSTAANVSACPYADIISTISDNPL